MASFTLRNKSLVRQAVSSIPKLSRGLAAQTTTAVKVPVQLFGIEGRYATALYVAAAKKNSLPAVELDIERIKKDVGKDQNLWTFFEDPSLSVYHKKEGVEILLRGKKCSDLMKNFLFLLAENGRLDKTTDIFNAFFELMTAHRGEVPIDIISAKSLDQKTLDRLKNALNKSKLVASNQKLIFENKVDPGILGGLIVHIGNEKTIDLSARAQVARMDKSLSEAI